MENIEKKPSRKTIIGVVVSNKMDKTIVVCVTGKKRHPIYKKYVTFSKKYKVHDEKNECNVGDRVEIVETRPISRDKHFKLLSVIERSK